jgi:hypothetical protein
MVVVVVVSCCGGMVVVVVVVSLRGGGEEDEKEIQPDSNVDATISTLNFLRMDVFTPSAIVRSLTFKGQCCLSSGGFAKCLTQGRTQRRKKGERVHKRTK